MEWTKLTVRCLLEDLETVTAFMSMLDNGLEIEDFSDVRCDPVYGDLISRFLRGEFGSNEAVHPQLVALLFAIFQLGKTNLYSPKLA